jgi:hypothetical protein
MFGMDAGISLLVLGVGVVVVAFMVVRRLWDGALTPGRVQWGSTNKTPGQVVVSALSSWFWLFVLGFAALAAVSVLLPEVGVAFFGLLRALFGLLASLFAALESGCDKIVVLFEGAL